MAATPQRTNTSAAMQVVAAVAVIAAVLLGLWLVAGFLAEPVADALGTDGYWTAVALGAVWFLIASFLVGRIWKLYPGLKLATRGAFLLTALVACFVFAWTSLRDDEVSEQVVTGVKASEASGGQGGGGGGGGGDEPAAQNVEEASGQFGETDHGPASGNAAFVKLASGERKLTITDLSVDNGPDLRVYLVPGDGSDVSDNVDLGALKGNEGDQQYDVPADVDTKRYSTVVIWCRAFSVSFAAAPLEAQ